MDIMMRGNGRVEQYKGNIVGFSNRLNTILAVSYTHLAERLYGLCHIVGAACLFYASTATGYDQMYWAMLLNLLVYMPT